MRSGTYQTSYAGLVALSNQSAPWWWAGAGLVALALMPAPTATPPAQMRRWPPRRGARASCLLPQPHLDVAGAAEVLALGWPSTPEGRARRRDLDAWLRGRGNARNPGATADLIAACLFALLRTRELPMIQPRFFLPDAAWE